MLRTIFAWAALAVAGLAGCAGGTGTPTPTGSPLVLYVPQAASTAAPGQISVYDVSGRTGTQAYIISGALTGLYATTAVARDASGDLYAVNAHCNDLDSITVYPPGARQNIAPLRTITGAATRLSCPQDTAFDASGNAYVTNSLGNSITVYAPGVLGNVAPIRVITGPSIISPEGVTLDGGGNIYVATDGNVDVFSPTASGSSLPAQTLKATGAHAVVLDASGNLYVSAFANGSLSAGEILKFAAGAQTGAAPIATISLGQSPMGGGYNGYGLAFDVSGKLYVAVANTADNGASRNNFDARILIYTLSGNVATLYASIPLTTEETPGFISF